MNTSEHVLFLLESNKDSYISGEEMAARTELDVETYLNNKSWENQIIPHDNGNKHNDSAERLADILVG